MSAEDVATVREAIFHAYDDPLLEGTVSYSALAALDRLAARLQEAERERDAVGENADSTLELWKTESDRAEAAEAREAALREALEFYADEKTYTQMTSWGGRIIDDEGPWLDDTGKRARVALAADAESEEAPPR